VTRPLFLRPEAQDDLLAARDWYEARRSGLGASFADEVEKTFARIASMPELHGLVYQNVRRVKIDRFPYVVYYRELQTGVQVIAVLHGHRSPRIWKDRA
jgi:toxin ParE1/3/4